MFKMDNYFAVWFAYVVAAFFSANAFAQSDSIRRLDTMVVRSQRLPSLPKISVDSEEKMLGRTDDLDNLLTAKPGVASAPNAQSLLLVNGDGPYDNVYMVRGIPVFAPSHFGGVPYLDRSVFSLGTPLDITFLTTGISGLYSGGSGSVLQVDPGIIHDPIHIARPEAVVDYGTRGADLTLSVPVYKDKDFFQISYRPADKYALWFLDEYKTTDNNVPTGFICPSSYSDLQILGSQQIGGIYFRQLFWLSQDTYADSTILIPDIGIILPPPKYKSFPWGIASFTLDSLKLPWCKSIVIGGASQHWFESHGGIGAFRKDVIRRNIAFSAEGPSLTLSQGMITTGIRTQYVPWSGRIFTPIMDLPDFYLPSDTLAVAGYQGDLSATQSYAQCSGNFSFGANFGEGMFFPGPKGFVDPGLWMKYNRDKLDLNFSCGTVTSQPDIREMPSTALETKLVRTFNGDLKFEIKPQTWITGSIEGFIKYKPFEPVKGANPQYPIWDDSINDHFIASGVNMEIEADLGKNIKVRTIQSFGKSTIFNDGVQKPYEWDIPWSTKTVAAYSLVDTSLTAYMISNYTAGLPYHLVEENNGALDWSNSVFRYEPFSRIDLKFQLNEPIPYQRHLMQYDVYLLITDLGGFFKNWDGRSIDPIIPLYHFYIGLRAHLRF
jgi:hypothetical protein